MGFDPRSLKAGDTALYNGEKVIMEDNIIAYNRRCVIPSSSRRVRVQALLSDLRPVAHHKDPIVQFIITVLLGVVGITITLLTILK